MQFHFNKNTNCKLFRERAFFKIFFVTDERVRSYKIFTHFFEERGSRKTEREVERVVTFAVWSSKIIKLLYKLYKIL